MINPDYEQLARLYVDVFADPPWNEFTVDKQGCGKYFGRNSQVGDECPACRNSVLEPFYDLKETKKYIQEDMAKTGSRLLIETKGGQPVGFGWGYVETPDEFSLTKYTKVDSRPKIVRALSATGLTQFEDAFYICEVGVKNDYRGRGFGTSFVAGLLGYARSDRLNSFMRTNQGSPMILVARKTAMEKVPMFDDPERSDRVLFTKKL